MSDPNTPESFDFEKSLAELTEIVESMETGQLSLEQSLAQFERGVTLVRRCQHQLQAAEQKVKTLTEQEMNSINGDSGEDS